MKLYNYENSNEDFNKIIKTYGSSKKKLFKFKNSRGGFYLRYLLIDFPKATQRSNFSIF